MDEKLQFPGLANAWTMRVENRLDMKLTSIKTPLGLKVQGTNVDGIQQLASQIQDSLSEMSQVRSVFSQKVAQGFYSGISGSLWRS
jgi:copper/silver efflux system protein